MTLDTRVEKGVKNGPFPCFPVSNDLRISFQQNIDYFGYGVIFEAFKPRKTGHAIFNRGPYVHKFLKGINDFFIFSFLPFFERSFTILYPFILDNKNQLRFRHAQNVHLFKHGKTKEALFFWRL